MQKFFNFFLIILTIFSVGFLNPGTLLAKFDITHYKNTSGLKKSAESMGYQNNNALNQPIEKTIALILKVFLSFLGVLFMGLILYGGYIWMMAQGNQEQVSKAQKIIAQSIVGLIIIIAAYAVTYYLGSQLKQSLTTDTAYNFQGI